MTRRSWTALSGVTVAAVALAMTQATAQAVPQQEADAHPQSSTQRTDDFTSPMGEQQRDLRKAAVEQLVAGKAKLVTINGKRVIKMASDAPVKGKSVKGPASKGFTANNQKKQKDRYVQYDVNREESIFTILTEFGTQTKQAQGGAPGPVHNEIAAPDRKWDGSKTDDNSTYWLKDFNRDHYQNMMFGKDENGESFKDFYLKQSNGRFLAKGDVSNWVTVPYNEARYGHNPVKGDGTSEADGYWNYIKDSATAWYNDQKAQGKTDADIKTYLAQFDKVDRYDYDGDGNFNEPDGYIDHFQAIHAGEGEEAGGGAQGDDAIWSHRWYAFSNNQGKTGPVQNKLGGVQLGDSGMWIGDYTTEPENGGLGVFTHEFGHDLGLPDLYDTAGGDNGTGFWTLMSSGSWLNHGKAEIGSTPGYMGPWEKLQLGWLDYTPVNYGFDRTVTVGPADRDVKNLGQALMVNLADKTVTTDYNTPHSGSYEWWGGSADNLNTTLSRSLDLTSATTSATLTAWAEYTIEQDYDNMFVEASSDGGATWEQVGAPVTGASTGWQQLSFDLSAYAGKQIDVRFRYATDGGLHYDGPFLDDIALAVDGANVWADDVEAGAGAWKADGFTRMTGTTSEKAQHYYLAENRVYAGYDSTLKTGPYNFVGADKPNWVEHFPYQNGLLVWYVDGQYTDNNTSAHPGHGLALPVDSHPEALFWKGGANDGKLVSNRIQPWDATFGTEKTDKLSLHKNGSYLNVKKQAPVRTFDDTNANRYWSAANPQNSTKVAGAGVQITVRKAKKDTMDLQVSFRKQGG